MALPLLVAWHSTLTTQPHVPVITAVFAFAFTFVVPFAPALAHAAACFALAEVSLSPLPFPLSLPATAASWAHANHVSAFCALKTFSHCVDIDVIVIFSGSTSPSSIRTGPPTFVTAPRFLTTRKSLSLISVYSFDP